MKFGHMNDPSMLLSDEIRWAGENGFDFVDVTLGKDTLHAQDIDTERVSAHLKEFNLEVVGHISPALIANTSYKAIRRGIVEELLLYVEKFAAIGAKSVSLHAPFMKSIDIPQKVEEYAEVFVPVINEAKKHDIQILIENVSGTINQQEFLRALFEKIPELGFHLDIGHCNLFVPKNTAEFFLKEFGDRLKHIHISDNNGGRDEHLPLGVGNINWLTIAGYLKQHKYDGMITLEVFSADRDYLLLSRDKLKAWLM